MPATNTAVLSSRSSMARRTPSGIGNLPSSQWRRVRSETLRYFARAAPDRPRNSRTTFNSAGVIRSSSGMSGGSVYWRSGMAASGYGCAPGVRRGRCGWSGLLLAAQDLGRDLAEPLGNRAGRLLQQVVEVDALKAGVDGSVDLGQGRVPVAVVREEVVNLALHRVHQRLREHVLLLAGVVAAVDVAVPAVGLVGAAELVVAGEDGGGHGRFLPVVVWGCSPDLVPTD